MLIAETARETLSSLRKVELVKPDNAGGKWAGIQHAELVRKIIAAVEAKGWTVGPTVAGTSRGGFDVTGSMPVVGAMKLSSIVPCLGFTRSNKNRRRLTFYAGGTVVDPDVDAGIVFASFTAEHRNLAGVDTDEDISTGIDRWYTSMKRAAKDVPKLKSTTVDQKEAFRLLSVAMNRSLLASSRVMKVMGTLDDPCSKWDLLKRFGWAVNIHNAPEKQMDQMRDFYQLVTVGALAASPVETS